MTLYPVFLDLSGQHAVVIGGGDVALRKARALKAAGALITVIAPELHPDFEVMNVTLTQREFQPSDLEGARLVFACTDHHDVNDRVAREARARSLWCNHASRPEHGDLRLGATVERGGVQISISSGSQLPHLAQALRDKVSAALPAELPVTEWTARRAAALQLPAAQREVALASLKAEIRLAVGV